jgi:hypothetical protein
MATPEKRIVRAAAARLAAEIDQRLPEQVAHLLAQHAQHEWASGHRFGADQAVVVTMAAYLIELAHAAWVLVGGPAAQLAASPITPRALLDERLRAAVSAPPGLPGYIRDELLSAVIDACLAERERREPHA